MVNNPGSHRFSFDAVLFDLDGTLIDSVEDIARSANHVRAQLGLKPLPVETVRGFVGDGVRVLFERAIETRDVTRIDQAVALWRPHYLEHCLDHTRLYPGVAVMLRQLDARGILLAVVTNKPAAPAEIILQGLGIRTLFRTVVGGDSTPKRKPDPEPLRFALEQMRVRSDRALVVGDSPNDILGAWNAGCSSCAVLWGIGGEALLRAAHADRYVRTPAELNTWIVPPSPTATR